MNFNANRDLTLSRDEIKKIEEEKISEYKQDTKFYEYLLKLGFNDELISKYVSELIDIHNEFKVCYKCTDFSTCPSGEHLVTRPNVDEYGELHLSYGFCKKYKKISECISRSSICDIPEEYFKYSLSNIDSMECRKPFIEKLIKLEEDSKPQFLFVNSKKKSGGTFISSIFYKDIIAKKLCSGIYCDCPKRFEELSYLLFNNKNEFSNLLNQYLTVDVLFLNKISSYNFNEFTRNNILFPIIERRISNGLTTVIMSEVSTDEFFTLLEGKNKNDVRMSQLKSYINSDYVKLNISSNIKVY